MRSEKKLTMTVIGLAAAAGGFFAGSVRAQDEGFSEAINTALARANIAGAHDAGSVKRYPANIPSMPGPATAAQLPAPGQIPYPCTRPDPASPCLPASYPY